METAMPEVRSVSRAFALLTALADGPQRITDLSMRSGLAKGTVARLLATLELEGAVTQDPDSRYRLGPAIGSLAARASVGSDLVAVARPDLERLAAKVGEAAGLSIAEGPAVRYIAQVSTPHEVQVRDWTGTTAPMHAVSSGHVLLAAMSTEEVRALLPPHLEALTPRTITRRSELERRLVGVRRAGYAWVRDEFAEGITSVAARVVDRQGGSVAAVHIHGPTYRFPRPGSDGQTANDLSACARRISELMEEARTDG
jgi:DNA-binding IclR family transcriptional regulator